MTQNERFCTYFLLIRSLLSCFRLSAAAVPGFSPVFQFSPLPLHLAFSLLEVFIFILLLIDAGDDAPSQRTSHVLVRV